MFPSSELNIVFAIYLTYKILCLSRIIFHKKRQRRMLMYIIKKDGTRDPFNVNKVVAAVNKSAERVLYQFSPDELDFICRFVTEKCKAIGSEGVCIAQMHNIVEGALDAISPVVAKSYRDYRNYKTDFVQMLDTVY